MAILSPRVRSTIATMIFVASGALSAPADTVPWTSPLSARATSPAALSLAASSETNLERTMDAVPPAREGGAFADSAQNVKPERFSRSLAAVNNQPPATVSAPLPTPAWSTAVLLVVAFLVVRRFKRKLV